MELIQRHKVIELNRKKVVAARFGYKMSEIIYMSAVKIPRVI